jgi:hypothetical protein
MKDSMESKSQALQDVFVSQLVTENKTYIEIGGYHPVKWSNTYNLEMTGWRGISIELNVEYKKLWTTHLERKNKIYWEDACHFDYTKALAENNLPMHIGYLSCDIEPPENTFAALQQVISQGITFDCITYEHDNYASKKDWNSIASEYLIKHNYKAVVHDVYPGNKKRKKFETWFVKNNIEFESTTFEQWKLCLKT